MTQWVTAGGYILAALVAGGFLLWNNRQRPHEVLKTMVEIHEKLPDSPERDAILTAINARIHALTTPKRRPFRSPTTDLARDLARSFSSPLAVFAVALADTVGLAVEGAMSAVRSLSSLSARRSRSGRNESKSPRP